jgi:hypothetical protein
MYVSIERTDVAKRRRFWLGVDRRGYRSPKRVDCDILALNRIDIILIPPRYTFFFGSTTVKNSEINRA